MSNYPNTGKGLKNMFIASVGSLVCIVLSIIPFTTTISSAGTLLFLVLSLVGLWTVGKDLAECKKAFWLTLVALICDAIANALKAGSLAVVAMIFSLVGLAATFGVTYYVCHSVGAALRTLGHEDIAKTGDKTVTVVLWTTVASIVCSILCVIPALAAVGTVALLLVIIAGVVGTVFYMIFLNKAYKVFGA